MSIMGGLWSRSDVTCKLLEIKRSRAGKFLLDKSSSLRNMLLFFLTCRWEHHDINIFKNISLLSKDWPPFFVRVFWVTKPHLRSQGPLNQMFLHSDHYWAHLRFHSNQIHGLHFIWLLVTSIQFTLDVANLK